MPTYTYQAVTEKHSCPRCRKAFEVIQPLAAPRLETCPECGAPIHKLIAAPAIGRSKSTLDQRAKAAGFHKLKKIGKGEYEKQY